MCGEVVFVLSVQYYYVTGRIDLFYSSRYICTERSAYEENEPLLTFPGNFEKICGSLSTALLLHHLTFPSLKQRFSFFVASSS